MAFLIGSDRDIVENMDFYPKSEMDLRYRLHMRTT